jgi:hypothetical protein
MTVPGAHACRAAADDLNTALGGDLKLTTFGPRLPELSREVELGDFFGRRVFGEPFLVGAFREDAPGEDGCMWRERNVACRNQETRGDKPSNQCGARVKAIGYFSRTSRVVIKRLKETSLL